MSPVTARTNREPEPAPWNPPSKSSRPNAATLTQRFGTALMGVRWRHGRTGRAAGGPPHSAGGCFRDELALIRRLGVRESLSIFTHSSSPASGPICVLTETPYDSRAPSRSPPHTAPIKPKDRRDRRDWITCLYAIFNIIFWIGRHRRQTTNGARISAPPASQ